MLWCCVEPERIEKTSWLMEAIAEGFGGGVCIGAPPDDGEPFAIWGQMWTVLEEVPKAIKSGRPFLHIDNGYVSPSRGFREGYWRICVNGLTARMIDNAPPSRIQVEMRDWRKQGEYIVLAIPGMGFGKAIGLDMGRWFRTSQSTLAAYSKRRIIVRPKKSGRTIPQDLHDAWALRTHSSNVAVDSILYGVPVFCEPTCPAAPVGNLNLADLENPAMPDRGPWFDSLMAQQFNLEELRNGLAREYVRLVSKDF